MGFKRTDLTVNEPIQISGTVLQPGKYTIRFASSDSYRHIVQVFDSDSRIIASILALPNYRLEVTGGSKFSFYETQAGEPIGLCAWFYPGDNFGQEFVYPKAPARQIARQTGSWFRRLTHGRRRKCGKPM